MSSLADNTFKSRAQYVSAVRISRDPAFASRIQFWINFLGDKDITGITADDVKDGLNLQRQRGKMKVIVDRNGRTRTENTDKPLSNATLNRYTSTLGSVFRELKNRGLLRRSFKSPLLGFGRLHENGGRTVTITVQQVRDLVAAARLSRNRKLAAWIATAATTGWRSGNLATLCWGDVDLDGRTIDTERTKNGEPHRARLLPWVCDELRRMRPDSATDGELVFGPGNLNKALQNALRLVDLPDHWTPHHMRHIAASVLAQSGASVPLIMSALNHKSPSMALRYSHLNTSATDKAMQEAWR
jgi:integrase